MEVILLNFMFIMLPVLLYLFYVAFNRSFGKEENELFLDLALLTSVFLSYRFGGNLFYYVCHIPFLYAFQKNRKFVMGYIFILSFLTVKNNPYVLIEYSFYFIIYIFMKKKKYQIPFLIVLKCFFLTISDIMPYFFITILSLILFQKGERILKFSMNQKELEQEKQMKDSLFKITHEIKNPIAVCKGYLDMFDVNNPEHFKKYIPIMKEEIDRTLFLLQDFLSISNIKMEKDILDINYLLEEVMRNFKPILVEKQIQTKMELVEEEVDIFGDYNRLCQVFINLIKNSIEAIHENGKLVIESKIENGIIRINIIDNGCGIEEEVLQKIKEPFFTTKSNGTGLGVSLSNEIVKKHQGSLNYDSKNGITKAIVCLPIVSF